VLARKSEGSDRRCVEHVSCDVLGVSRVKARTFWRVRRLTVAKVCAMWLIALVLLPWTAPFRTLDVSHSSGRQRFETLPKDKVDGDAALLVKPTVAVQAVFHDLSSDAFRPNGGLDPRPVGPAVLRI
jgi:hypothetical protein